MSEYDMGEIGFDREAFSWKVEHKTWKSPLFRKKQVIYHCFSWLGVYLYVVENKKGGQ